MDSLASSELRSDKVYHRDDIDNSPKLKTYRFVVAIILAIGALAVGGAGMAGYFHVGALSNMAQMDAIITMAVGSGIAATLFMVGIVGIVKNRQKPLKDVTTENAREEGSLQKTESTNKIEITSVNTHGGLIYGDDVWPALGDKWSCRLEILDEIPEAPKEDVAEGKIRIYIPRRIRVNGEEKDFTLNTLVEMGGGLISYYSESVKKHFGDNTASGWVEIDKKLIPESQGKEDPEILEKIVEEKNCRMPSILEVVTLNLMVFAFTGERLYGELIHTYCYEKISEKHPHSVPVGGFKSDGLCVGGDGLGWGYGVAGVRRF